MPDEKDIQADAVKPDAAVPAGVAASSADGESSRENHEKRSDSPAAATEVSPQTVPDQVPATAEGSPAAPAHVGEEAGRPPGTDKQAVDLPGATGTVPLSEPAQEPGGEQALALPAPEKTASSDTTVAAESPAQVVTERRPQPAKPKWRVLEPTDRIDAVPHKASKLRKRGDWHFIGASVRGWSKANRGRWRDDAFALGCAGRWMIAAVCDGVGSVPLSRVGARIGSTAAVTALKELLGGFRLHQLQGRETPTDADCSRLRTFLAEAARRALVGIQQEAKARNCPVGDLHTTLHIMVHTIWKGNDLIGSIQVGDGAIGVYTDDSRCTVLATDDHGERPGEVRVLTEKGMERELPTRAKVTLSKRPVRCIAVATDGVMDCFFPLEDRLHQLFVGDPIDHLTDRSGNPLRGVMLSVLGEPQPAKALVEWLHYDSPDSFDDRTLALLIRIKGRGAWPQQS